MTVDEIAKCIPDEVVWKIQDKMWRMGGSSVEEVRAALAAGLAAWPGIQHIVWNGQLILHLKAPLTKETT
jgi:hypothetical protein